MRRQKHAPHNKVLFKHKREECGGAKELGCEWTERGSLQRLCGTPGARSGEARPQSEVFLPELEPF
jgi:hypothetical protein